MLGSSNVLITDTEGRIEEIVPVSEAGEDIQQFEGILTPGFINCHCHLELSHMKSLIPEHTGLVDFVFKVVNERHFPEEEIADAITKAEEEMLANGIVAVGDICNNTSTLFQKTKNRLAYYNFIEVSGWMPSVAKIRFERSHGYYHSFAKPHPEYSGPNPSPSHKLWGTSKPQTSLSPHAPYSVSDELWQLISPYFENKTVTIHNQETAFEDDLFLSGTGDFSRMYAMMKMDTSFFHPTGKSSLQSYFHKLDKAKQVLLVHNTFTKEVDIGFVNRTSSNVNWCVCINANQYIEQAIPPIDLLRKNNCQIVVGTDSLASNWSLSILDELKTIRKYFPSIALNELLQWSTINGAIALQMDDQLGSFEKGKKPGVVLLENIFNERFDSATIKRLV
jgi:cytosine/adenosine deaminase-related metal-dependent hydrolase